MELIHEQQYETRQRARAEIFEFIEVYYNRERLHSSLGYLSPADYEAKIAAESLPIAAEAGETHFAVEFAGRMPLR